MIIYTIIVTYNGRKWVDFCLGSLRCSSVETTPIIIDNCSTDDTLAYIQEQYPETIIFPQRQNLGFGQANNVGLRYALAHNADYVLLLNQDAAIAPDAIELMLAQSDGESLLSPIHMNGDGSRLDNHFREGTLTKCNALLNDIFAGTMQDSYECGEVCAACWLIPRKIIEEIGGFNPLFFHYSEDNNYYQRLVYHHIKVFLVPKARMYHDRTEFGNKQVWDAQWLRNTLTLAYTNINLTSWQRRYTILRTLWTCYAYHLCRRQYRIGSFFVSLCHLIMKLPIIRKSRNAEKQITSNWL